ncbi:hypothetical protein MHTCC0001_12760 [Flavobacteriaceae bacterium MHTCC 0001]
MSKDQLTTLRAKLKNYETDKTHQIVVLTINDLGENTIEGYALQVFNQNKLGQKDKDNGLLVLFSKNDRKVRLEVGYGLEPIITDAISSRIIREIMIPEFKAQRYFEGIDKATSEIIKIIDDPKYRDEFIIDQSTNNSKNDMSMGLRLGILLIVVLFFGIFIFLGGMVFWHGYKQLIYLHKGLIIGKISVLSYPFMLLSCVFPVVFGLVFIIMPLSFLVVIIISLFMSSLTHILSGFPENVFNSGYINISNGLLVACIIFIISPLLIAIFKRSYSYPEPFKLSFKNNKKYVSKHISSFGSSSYSSGSSSSSSWSSSGSSFSGGGGSSGGGGASGSW